LRPVGHDDVAAGNRPRRGAVELRARLEPAALDPGRHRDDLEDRAGWIAGLDGSIQEDAARVLVHLPPVLGRDAEDEDVRVEARATTELSRGSSSTMLPSLSPRICSAFFWTFISIVSWTVEPGLAGRSAMVRMVLPPSSAMIRRPPRWPDSASSMDASTPA